MKKVLAIILMVTMLLLNGAALAETPVVVATSFPCYDLVRQVLGEHGEVRLLIRPGTEVHSYEPSPSDILSIGEAEVFVYVGGESDAWVEDILSSLGQEIPRTILLMDSVELLESEHHHAEADHDHQHEEHDHESLEMDEHIWTSPKNALLMLEMVVDALCQEMPEFEEDFRANGERYAAEIEAIDRELTGIIEEGTRRKVIFADRFPFLYLAHDYDLAYDAAFNSCTTETEPSAQKMVELIEEIVTEKIPVVYTIEMSNGKIAKTIAEETGVEILSLHSIQTVTQQEFDRGETYVTLMRKNLDALRKGLS